MRKYVEPSKMLSEYTEQPSRLDYLLIELETLHLGI